MKERDYIKTVTEMAFHVKTDDISAADVISAQENAPRPAIKLRPSFSGVGLAVILGGALAVLVVFFAGKGVKINKDDASLPEDISLPSASDTSSAPSDQESISICEKWIKDMAENPEDYIAETYCFSSASVANSFERSIEVMNAILVKNEQNASMRARLKVTDPTPTKEFADTMLSLMPKAVAHHFDSGLDPISDPNKLKGTICFHQNEKNALIEVSLYESTRAGFYDLTVRFGDALEGMKTNFLIVSGLKREELGYGFFDGQQKPLVPRKKVSTNCSGTTCAEDILGKHLSFISDSTGLTRQFELKSIDYDAMTAEIIITTRNDTDKAVPILGDDLTLYTSAGTDVQDIEHNGQGDHNSVRELEPDYTETSTYKLTLDSTNDEMLDISFFFEGTFAPDSSDSIQYHDGLSLIIYRDRSELYGEGVLQIE